VNGTVYTPNGPANFNVNYYDPAAASVAMANASAQNEAMIENTIDAGQRNMATLQHAVLKDNTIMPGEWVGGQVHITSPSGSAGQPKTININIAGETHIVTVTQEQSKQ
jgi:hypothetical protein